MMIYGQTSLDDMSLCTSPIWTRSVGIEGRVIKEVEVIISGFENGLAANVSTIPTGPRVDPGGLSDTISKQATSDRALPNLPRQLCRPQQRVRQITALGASVTSGVLG
jgi:hypothetical protein